MGGLFLTEVPSPYVHLSLLRFSRASPKLDVMKTCLNGELDTCGDAGGPGWT